MKLVQEPMKDGGKNDCDTRKKCQSAEERITPGKDFAGIGLQRCEWSHTGENHRRVRKCIQPTQVFQKMIPCHSKPERKNDERRRDREPARHAPVKNAWRRQRLSPVLEHGSENVQSGPKRSLAMLRE